MARFADVTGRYLYVTVDGIEYRVYFEEAGAGIPIVLQHTAGADGRQWRHVLEDEWITSHFRRHRPRPAVPRQVAAAGVRRVVEARLSA